MRIPNAAKLAQAAPHRTDAPRLADHAVVGHHLLQPVVGVDHQQARDVAGSGIRAMRDGIGRGHHLPVPRSAWHAREMRGIAPVAGQEVGRREGNGFADTLMVGVFVRQFVHRPVLVRLRVASDAEAGGPVRPRRGS